MNKPKHKNNFIIIKPSKHELRGQITLPSSKSISNRVLIISALSYSDYEIENLSDCDDTEAVIRVLNSDSNNFDIGAAGTAMRFLTAFLSKIVGEWTITGSERMKQRPIKVLVDALNSLGAKIEYTEKEGYPPLKIYGSALQGGEIDLDGSISSQYISALLMIAPNMQNGLTINLKGKVISKPYISLTLKLMAEFGIESTWNKGKITIAPQEYKPKQFKVESDWSAASYWYEILALKGEGEIFLEGLEKGSYQGDAEVARLFAPLGVNTTYTKDGVKLNAVDKTAASMIYNFVEEPDLAQTFVVACCLLGVPFSFSGLESLKIKETDRIAALIAEMSKLGYLLHETPDGILEWNGKKTNPREEIIINTYEDHRMAMCFAPAAIKFPGIKIAEPQVVTKSYPLFWKDLKQEGFEIIDN
ncbi:3-phosphoshikimate 1-carboxyvinyltransferase [Bacteroidales bacterium OttesenSCG-928-I21]|nr:3-phosphoshikimate 1-carboxyvinyltransferase [Bacteroidales bacterium OttesenSCG-928-I21]